MLRAALVTAFVVLAVPASAMASPADVSAADALFREARAAAKKSDYATACPKFRESYRLDPTVGTLLNVGDCDEHEGHILSAITRFGDASSRLSPSDDRATYVRSRMHALESRVAQITGNPAPDLHIQVDGVAVTKLPLRIDPGPHALRIVGPNRDEERTLTLKDGETREVDFAAPVVNVPVAKTPKPSRVPAYVVGGAGAFGFITTGVFVGLMYHEKKIADANCQGAACSQTGRDATSDGKRDGLIGGITFGASAVAIGVATYLFFRGSSKENKPVAIGDYVLGGAL